MGRSGKDLVSPVGAGRQHRDRFFCLDQLDHGPGNRFRGVGIERFVAQPDHGGGTERTRLPDQLRIGRFEGHGGQGNPEPTGQVPGECEHLLGGFGQFSLIGFNDGNNHG